MARQPSARLLASLTIGALSFAALGWISWWQWQTLTTPSWDLGIFTQLVHAYANGTAPIVEIKGPNFNLLGDHFHPILVLLGPLYWLWPSPLTLLLAQDALFAFAAAALTWRSWELTAPWVATSCGLILALAWPTQTAVASQFHEIAFAVPLLVLSLTAYLAGRYRAAAGWIAGLVFVKEDLGLTVLAFAFVLGYRAWRLHRRGEPAREITRLAILTGLWGLVWFVLTIAVILPALNPHGSYDYTGNIAGGGLTSLFVPAVKWALVGLLVMTGGIIAITSPLIVLLVPTLAWRFAGNVEFYWWIGWHYDVILLPILLAALLEATGESSPLSHYLTHWRRPVRAGAVLLAGASSLLVFAHLPLFHTPPSAMSEASTNARLHAANQVRALVAQRQGAQPSPLRVASDGTMLARLVDVATVSWIGDGRTTPDLVVIDDAWAHQGPQDVAANAQAYYGVEYREVYQSHGLRVAERVVHR